VAKRSYRKMTVDERARQLEHQRFIDEVVARAAERAGIRNTPEERGRYIQRVVDDVLDARPRRDGV